MKPKKILVVASAVFLASIVHADLRAQDGVRVTNHEANGNLQSTVKLGCIPASDVKTTYSPADLYRAVAVCVEGGDMKKGVLLYVLAGVYGRFDTLRVSDKTAHQALTVLQMENLDPIAEDKSNQFREEIGRVAQDEDAHAELCSVVREIGPPTYYPRYMIQHGMGAFFGGSGDGLVRGFDPAAGWNEAMSKYLHC